MSINFEETFPPLLCLGMYENFPLNFFLVYQQILNVLKKHIVNVNWLKLKNGKKCKLGVNHKPKNMAIFYPYDFEKFPTFIYKIHMYHGIHDDNTT